MTRANKTGSLLRALTDKLPEDLKLALERMIPDARPQTADNSPEKSKVNYDHVVTTAWDQAMQHSEDFENSMAEAGPLIANLLGLSPPRRRLHLLNQPALHTTATVIRLLRLSWEQRSINPADSEHLAHLALEILHNLDEEDLSAGLIEDLRARAWGQIGNARRIQSDLQGADEALVQAERHLARGSQDPLEQALIDHWMGGLRRDQRRFDEAIRLLKRACREYRKVRNHDNHAQALITLGHTLRVAGDPESALGVMQRAESLLESDHSLVLYVRHNQIDFLIDLGRHEQAESLLSETRPLYAHAPEPLNRLRLPWVEGRIARHTGRPQEAEYLFQKVRQGFIEHGIAYDAALVSLELAEIYVQQGRNEELKELAQEMVTVFRSRNVEREALAALLMLHHAASAERATLHVIRDIAARLRERAPQALTPLSPGDA